MLQDLIVVKGMAMTALPFTSPLLPCAECPDKERHSCLPLRLKVEAEEPKAEERKGRKKKGEKEERRKRRDRNQTKPDWATLPDLLLIKIFKYLSIEVRPKEKNDAENLEIKNTGASPRCPGLQVVECCLQVRC